MAEAKQGEKKLTSGEPPQAGPTGARDEAPHSGKPAPKASLAPAGESGDPEVHRLLAERQTAATNLAAASPDEDAKARGEDAQKRIAEIDKQLADLGVSAT